MKKAFTLIELLAVIIVLAIVALIATPLLLDVIEDSRKSAAKSSTALILDAAKLYYTENYFKNEGDFQEYECSYNDKKGCDALVLNGEKPNSGTLKISATGVVNGKITYGKYTYYICNNNISEIESDGCSFVDYEQIYAIKEDGIITGFKTTEEVTLLNVLIPVVNATNLTPEANDYIQDRKITIPEYIGDIEVNGIGANAFSGYDFDTVTILPKKELIIEQNSFQPNLPKMYVQKGFKEYYNDYAIEVIEMEETKQEDVKVHIPTVSISKSVVNNKNVLTAIVDMTTLVSEHNYAWYKDGILLEGETSSTLTATQSGKYNVNVTMKGQTGYSNDLIIQSYTIIYNLNGGAGSIENTIKTEDINTIITSTIPKKDGVEFKGWATTSNAAAVEYASGSTYTKNEDITLYAVWEKTKICRRATTLHTETCNRTGTSYCGRFYTNGSKITYGNTTTTSGVLKSGDAFDCDVNGDGKYDAATERFYYVSPLYNTTSKSFDSNYAVLTYYTSSKSAYNENGDNEYGPLTATNVLPTTSQWSKVKLLSTPRAILNEVSDNTTYKGKKSLPTAYTYSGRAAILLTTQELGYACGITVGSKTDGELKNCLYLLENTSFSGIISIIGIWLETPNSTNDVSAWYAAVTNADVTSATTSNSNYAVRPVIEVKLEDISY